ncbi:MAG: PDZ domain-containing protein [Pseudomonadota bacterium]
MNNRLIAIALLAACSLLGTGQARANDDKQAEMQLREAEQKLQAAAAEVARLSRGLAPDVIRRSEHLLSARSGPRLGVTLATTTTNGAFEGEGVEVMSVSPGSAAADAGIQAGDRLVGFEGESLREISASQSVAIMKNALKGKKVGDSVLLDVLRDDAPLSMLVTLNESSLSPVGNALAIFSGEPGQLAVLNDDRLLELRSQQGKLFDGDEQVIHERFLSAQGPRFEFISLRSAWSSMELVELTPGLGEYFGTDSGILVVRAPADDSLGFQDGDVIKRIGDRTPEDVGHAMRILRSYKSGEKLEVEVLRNRKKRSLDIDVPERVGKAPVNRVWEWHSENTVQAPPVPEFPAASTVN